MKLELTEIEKELMEHCLGLANIMCMKVENEDLTEGQNEWLAEAAVMAIQQIAAFDESVMRSLFEKIFDKTSQGQALLIEKMRREFKSL